MIQRFDATFSTPFVEFWKNACMTLQSKECHELRDAFQFLLIWQDYLQCRYGKLEALSHLSNPDDPPDVIAHFHSQDVPVEISTIDPTHIRQSDELHIKIGGGSGRTEIPLSIKPRSRQEALEMMYGSSDSTWESSDDRNQVWFNSICVRAGKKLSNPMLSRYSQGIILLTGKLNGTLGEDHAICAAFRFCRSTIPESAEWTLATCYQWNDTDYFSAIDAPGLGFRIKRHGT